MYTCKINLFTKSVSQMIHIIKYSTFNTLRPRQNGCHFADIFKCIFFNENVWILINISLRFIPQGPVNNIPRFGSDNGLAQTRRQTIIWTNDDIGYRRIYASLGFNEHNKHDKQKPCHQRTLDATKWGFAACKSHLNSAPGLACQARRTQHQLHTLKPCLGYHPGHPCYK